MSLRGQIKRDADYGNSHAESEKVRKRQKCK